MDKMMPVIQNNLRSEPSWTTQMCLFKQLLQSEREHKVIFRVVIAEETVTFVINTVTDTNESMDNLNVDFIVGHTCSFLTLFLSL